MNAQGSRTRLKKLNYFELRPHHLFPEILEPSRLPAGFGNTPVLDLYLPIRVSMPRHKRDGKVDVTYPVAPCEKAAEHDHLPNPVSESYIAIGHMDAF